MTSHHVTLCFPSTVTLGPALSRATHWFPLRIPGLLTWGPHFPLGRGLHTLLPALFLFAQPGQDGIAKFPSQLSLLVFPLLPPWAGGAQDIPGLWHSLSLCPPAQTGLISHGNFLGITCRGEAAEPGSICIFSFELFPASKH